MISKVNVVRHPVHPMLVPIPIGLWIFSLVCDFVFHSTHNDIWDWMALYTLAGGIIGALAAAVPGLLDLINLPTSEAKRVGIWHLVINLTIVGMYVINFFWRRNVEPAAVGPVILSVFAVILLALSGWLGGELIYRHGVGVARVNELEPLAPREDEPRAGFGFHLHHRH